MQPGIDDLLRLARGAGDILLAHFDRPLKIDHKGAVDLVTEADRQSEDYLLAEIRRAWPEHSILAEESGQQDGTSDSAWLIDPLDGTTNFAHGLPIFSVSIAFADAQGVQLGVVCDPTRAEAFWAARGQGAWLGQRQLHVSDVRDLVNSLLVTGFPYDRAANPDNNLDYFNHIMLRCRGIRRLGSAALDLAYVAAGRMDGFWEIRLQPWDVAAGMLIAQEAGAVVTRLHGEPDVLRRPCSVLAANPALHPLLLNEMLRVREQRAQP
ncbi:MAG: inositol monophosphatase [Chloroflexi bacterium]|nr:inositol monophosphatase [Chloroflexota bacterium]